MTSPYMRYIYSVLNGGSDGLSVISMVRSNGNIGTRACPTSSDRDLEGATRTSPHLLDAGGHAVPGRGPAASNVL